MRRTVSVAFAFSLALAAAASTLAARAGEAIRFRSACDRGDRVIVAAVGDLLFHAALQRQALRGRGSYAEFWRPVRHILEDADITYGNLEGAVAEGVAAGGRDIQDPGRRLDGRVYTGAVNGMIFNYHPSLVDDLKDSGFDIVSTANNHAGDRGVLGVDRTIDALERGGLAFAGTRRRGEERLRPWSTVVEANGVRVAFIACTYGSNGGADSGGRMLNCYRDRDQVFGEIRWSAEDPDVDAVILTPHWGVENSATPLPSDRFYARAAIDAGADVIIGAHPHVLQPWEKLTTRSGREGLVIYSLGNFISNQPWTPNRSGAIALIEFVKPMGERARLSAVGFVPTWVERSGWRHRVVELRQGTPGTVGALSQTLRRLPAANRVGGQDAYNLPRRCSEPAAGLEVAFTQPKLHWPLQSGR